MAKHSIEFRSDEEPPELLAKILEKILNPSDIPAYHQQFVDAINAAKIAYFEGRAGSDADIWCDIAFSQKPREECYYNAYIKYLGKTLFYQEKLQNDVAWHYYAQSRYYKGLLDAWDAVLKQVDDKIQAIEDRRQGGLKKAAKQTGPLKDEFIRIIESPPQGGWKNKRQLLDDAVPKLQDLKKSLNLTFPLYENMLTVAGIWLRNDLRIMKAFLTNLRNEYDYTEITHNTSDPNDCRY